MAKSTHPPKENVIELVNTRLVTLVCQANYAFGDSPHSVFPLTYSVQAPSIDDLKQTYSKGRMTVRLVYGLVADRSEDERDVLVARDPETVPIFMSAAFDLVAKCSRKPTEAAVKRFVTQTGSCTVYPIFRSKVREFTVEAGFPPLNLSPTLDGEIDR